MSVPPGQPDPNETTPQGAAPGRKPGGGDEAVLEMLGDFQSSMENLKQLYAQRVAMNAELKKRENELGEQARRLAAMHADLRSKEAELARARETIDKDRHAQEHAKREHERREQELAKVQIEIEQRRREIDLQRGQVEGAQRELAERDAVLRQQAGTLDDARRRVAELEKELAARQTAGDEQARAFESARGRVQDLERTLAEREGSVREHAQGREQAMRRAGELEQEIAAREAAMKAQRGESESLRGRVAELERELSQTRGNVTAQTANALQATESLRKDLQQSRAQLDELQAALASLNESAGRTRSELAQEQERSRTLEATAAKQAEELKAALASAEKLSAELARSRIQPVQQIAQAQAELDRVRQTFESERALLESAAKAQSDAMAEVQAELERLKNSAGSQVKDIATERQRLQTELAAAQRERDRVTKDLEALKKDSAGPDAARQKLEKAAEVIRQLKGENEQQKSELERLRGKPQVGAGGDVASPLRRERLRKARRIIREQDAKLKKAGEVLRTRFEQCEQVLAMRGEVVQARDAVNAMRRRADHDKAKGRTAATLFYSLGVIGILGALSWVVTGLATPGLYHATGVLSAESRTRELNEGEMGEWVAFHQQVLNDPRFHEAAAERMTRNGIVSLGTPGSIATMVKDELDARSSAPGELTLELRGEGGERTARVLDKLMTAVASFANASKQQRVDGATTKVRQPAVAGTQPIDNTRMLYAAGAWAGSSFLTFLVGVIVWRRMLKAKSTFESSSRVDELLEGAHWSTPGVTGPLRSAMQASTGAAPAGPSVQPAGVDALRPPRSNAA